ncbi:hypothetical protein UFOVP633_3 [uncultured Caudovirales phage]|uniref:Uncharacterized protein n=1 Tax=uncultured Caudovirales phage TaxID=2100421 RepID=A0A6J5N4W0_9CAUD|nr:hypothetical protein UFOVP633_3 [uncultured Caudovirales phage]
MNEQSSIEQLVSWMKANDYPIDVYLEEVIDQVKENHKGELKRAFLKNDNSISIEDALERFEDYYNETFKNK